jgi:hypothetical protein
MTASRKKPGAPKKPDERSKKELLQLRVGAAEKATFSDAADLDGKTLSEWIRDRLRRISRQELEAAGQPVHFLTGNTGQNQLK